MKNGSGRRSKKNAKAPDITSMVKEVHHEAPQLEGETALTTRMKALAPIPDEAHKNPVEWAEKHIESLAPHFAKEIEWAAKFGSDQMRYNAARDGLAMKGLTTKPKETGVIPQAMVFVNMGPTGASGAPLLPFMNAAAPRLDAGKAPVTVDVTPTKAPTTEPKK